MSTPSTPSGVGSPSRSSPANSHNGGVHGQLTPRSKVKAMLAALDDDSDDNCSNPPVKMARSSHKVAEHFHPTDNRSDGAVTDDGEESDVVAPRGKLASRLQGHTAMEQGENGRDTSKAYERIKQQLLQKPADNTPTELQLEDTPGRELPRKRIFLRKKVKAVEDIAKSTAPGPSSRAVSPSDSLTQGSRIGSQPCSPGLIASPKNRNASASIPESGDSDSDLPSNLATNARFLALVAKKREERQAKAAAEEKKRAEKRVSLNELVEDSSDDDAAAGTKLTQQSRPTRKASKKALEEMHRETQRLSRNMQLAHQAKTNKKITKDSFLTRFNFRTMPTPPASGLLDTASPNTASSVLGSDGEGPKDHNTPPTSPMEPEGFVEKPPPLDHPVPNAGVLGLDMNEELPSVDDLISHSVQQWVKGKGKAVDDLHSIEDVLPRCGPSADKGKGKAIEESQSSNAKSNKTHFTRGPLRVIGLANSSKHQCTLDSDSELEILPVTVKSRKLDIFDRLPPQKITDQGRSLRTLRVLANLTSPGKKTDKAKGSMTPAEMHMSLQRTARQQAAKERAEKLQDLKDRGIMVQTAEERQRDQADIEDLLEKARREADELKKKEKDGTKKERHADGQGELTDSSDEDEDYRDAEDEAQGDGLDVELSGSEEEELDEMEDEEAEGEEEGEMELADGQSNHMTVIDNEATEDQAEEPMDREDVEDEIEDEDLDENVPILQHKRRSKITRVIDEEEDEIEGISSPPARKPASVVNPFIPSLTGSDEAPMGLTQAFAATLGDSESQKDGETFAVEQDSLDFLRATPVREFAMPDSMPLDLVVTDSQAGHSAWQRQTQGLDIDLHVSQSQIDHDTMLTTATQYSDIPDPTQDAGFQLSPPLPDRFASPPPSTIDTVPLHRASPVVKKKGRLRSRAEAIATFSDEDLPASDADDADEFTTPANAFDVMKKANQKPAVRVESFDKKKSDAKRMVEEQAEESEDEYAGLGGASDDDSGAEDDEEVRKMIDEGDVEVDERKLAAFYADKERASDEKAVEKLFKDINSGMLRRKRGAEFDLSDSDDDVEARRRRKRREFAKMRKALLENEKLGKIAEDPKKLAFLRAIEDREDDPDMNFLDQPDENSQETQEIPDSQPLLEANSLKRKRGLQDAAPDVGNRPGPQARRTSKAKRPSTLAEIRESVSFLIEEADGGLGQPSSDVSDGEHEATALPFAAADHPIIDRISLKRAESAALASASTRLAFHDPSSSTAGPAFRVPSLLRRATMQAPGGPDRHGISTAAGTERAAGGGEQGDFVRRGGTKKSSINYRAREQQRSKGQEAERRREERRQRAGALRQGGVLGALGGGTFE